MELGEVGLQLPSQLLNGALRRGLAHGCRLGARARVRSGLLSRALPPGRLPRPPRAMSPPSRAQGVSFEVCFQSPHLACPTIFTAHTGHPWQALGLPLPRARRGGSPARAAPPPPPPARGAARAQRSARLPPVRRPPCRRRPPRQRAPAPPGGSLPASQPRCTCAVKQPATLAFSPLHEHPQCCQALTCSFMYALVRSSAAHVTGALPAEAASTVRASFA